MKFKYLVITEDYELYGTNDEAAAKDATEWAQVVDLETMTNNCFNAEDEKDPWGKVYKREVGSLEEMLARNADAEGSDAAGYGEFAVGKLGENNG